MILGGSSFKVVQMVPVHCICRSQVLKIDFLTKNLKHLLVRNHWTDFNIILQNVPLVILYQDCSSHLDLSKNMAVRGRGLFSQYIYIENFENLLVRNHWTDFHIILQKCSFCDPLPKLYESFVKKHGRQGAGLIFPIYLNRKLEKIFLSETTAPISILFCRNIPLVILYQDCSSHLDSSKNMAARGRGLLSLYIDIENFKNLLVRNHWTNFHLILQKCSFCDPLPRLFEPFGFVKKHGRQGAGLIFTIYLHVYRNLWKSSCQKPLDRFPYNFAEMFLFWSSTKIVVVIWIRQKTWPPGGGAYFPYISI